MITTETNPYVFAYVEGGIVQTMRVSNKYGYLLALMHLWAERDRFDHEGDDARIFTAGGVEIYSYQDTFDEFLTHVEEVEELPLKPEAERSLIVYEDVGGSYFSYLTFEDETWSLVEEEGYSGNGFATLDEVAKHLQTTLETVAVRRVELVPSK